LNLFFQQFLKSAFHNMTKLIKIWKKCFVFVVYWNAPTGDYFV